MKTVQQSNAVTCLQGKHGDSDQSYELKHSHPHGLLANCGYWNYEGLTVYHQAQKQLHSSLLISSLLHICCESDPVPGINTKRGHALPLQGCPGWLKENLWKGLKGNIRSYQGISVGSLTLS